MHHRQRTLLRARRHRGITSLLAMLFVTLFAALAVGFYASVTTAVQVSYNDQRGTLALTAADSGMDFMRYQLANVWIPPNTDPLDATA
jgi:type II secretory pathway component PulK